MNIEGFEINVKLMSNKPYGKSKCTNEYMIIDINNDDTWLQYLSSNCLYHNSLLGPVKDNIVNWDEWFLPKMRNILFHHIAFVILLRSSYQHENFVTNVYNSFGNWSDDCNIGKVMIQVVITKNCQRLNGSVCSIDDSSDGEYNCYHGWFSGPPLPIYRQFDINFVGNRLVIVSFHEWLGCTSNADDLLIVYLDSNVIWIFDYNESISDLGSDYIFSKCSTQNIIVSSQTSQRTIE